MVVSCHVFAWCKWQGSQEKYSTLLTIKPSLQSYMTLFMTRTSTDLYFSLITINSNMYFNETCSSDCWHLTREDLTAGSGKMARQLRVLTEHKSLVSTTNTSGVRTHTQM